MRIVFTLNLILIFFVIEAHAFYPLLPLGNTESLKGNTGFSERFSESAPAYNPASLSQLKFNNLSAGTSFLSLTKFETFSSNNVSDKSGSPDFKLNTGFLGIYFKGDYFNYGFFTYNKYKFEINKYLVFNSADFKGDALLDANIDSTRVGTILASSVNPSLSYGATLNVDINTGKNSVVQKLLITSTNATSNKYVVTDSKVTVLSLKSGVRYETPSENSFSIGVEFKGVQLTQKQNRSGATVSTDGSVTDETVNQDTDETTPATFFLGYAIHNWNYIDFTFDYTITEGQKFKKALIFEEVPRTLSLGLGAVYKKNNDFSYYYGAKSTSVQFEKDTNTQQSNTVNYLSAGLSRKIKFLQTSGGVYYSTYETKNEIDASSKQNIKSVGLIFNTSYDY